jgi:hypothetical protein
VRVDEDLLKKMLARIALVPAVSTSAIVLDRLLTSLGLFPLQLSPASHGTWTLWARELAHLIRPENSPR